MLLQHKRAFLYLVEFFLFGDGLEARCLVVVFLNILVPIHESVHQFLLAYRVDRPTLQILI